MNDSISILIVDDHPAIRATVKTVISNIIPHVIIHEAADGITAKKKLDEHNYSIVIMDLRMPGTDTGILVRDILEQRPGIKILIYSMHDEAIYAKQYLKMGVMGYLQKNADVDELEKAIETVLSNQRYISDPLSKILAEEALDEKSSNPFEKLSQQEFLVMTHLVKMESVSVIAKELSLHTSTIGTHKARIFKKLGITDMAGLLTLVQGYNLNLD